jgi:hypothetical protein
MEPNREAELTSIGSLPFFSRLFCFTLQLSSCYNFENSKQIDDFIYWKIAFYTNWTVCFSSKDDSYEDYYFISKIKTTRINCQIVVFVLGKSNSIMLLITLIKSERNLIQNPRQTKSFSDALIKQTFFHQTYLKRIQFCIISE